MELQIFLEEIFIEDIKQRIVGVNSGIEKQIKEKE